MVGRVDGSGMRYRVVKCESACREAVGVERRSGLADCARAFLDRVEHPLDGGGNCDVSLRGAVQKFRDLVK
jgi:hypothetical protein